MSSTKVRVFGRTCRFLNRLFDDAVRFPNVFPVFPEGGIIMGVSGDVLFQESLQESNLATEAWAEIRRISPECVRAIGLVVAENAHYRLGQFYALWRA